MKELNAKQEDIMLEEGQEKYYNKKQKQKSELINVAITKASASGVKEVKKLCAFCGIRKASIPIQDGETLREIEICEYCDKELNCSRMPCERCGEYFAEEDLGLVNSKYVCRSCEKEVELISETAI